MQKHVDDDGNLNVFAGDGELLYSCEKCGQIWQIRAEHSRRDGQVAEVRDDRSTSLTFEKFTDNQTEASEFVKRTLAKYPGALGPKK